MKFIGEFVEKLEQNRQEYRQLLGLGADGDEIKDILIEQLEHHWHPLPEPEDTFTQEYAVDSSSAHRSLSNGLEFFITRALMLGSHSKPIKLLDFHMVKGISDYNTISNFERLQRDLIEINIVRHNLEAVPDGSLVLIDGNLYGRFTHMLKQLNLPKWRDLPLRLIDSMQTLFKQCVEKGVMLIGVSKFSKTRVVSAAMLKEKGIKTRSPNYLDVELLYQQKQGETGYTTPLILGMYAFEREANLMEGNPEEYQRRNFPVTDKEWAVKVIEDIPYSPAVVMMHFKPSPEHQPMRIDVPACCLGINNQLRDSPLYEFTSPETATRILKHLTMDFGGRDVYNALLYIVDKEVKLSPSSVDHVYRSVLSRELEVPIDYDRSSRRFMV